MRIAVATVGGHPLDQSVWSGIPRAVVQALIAAGVEPELIGPVAPRHYRAGLAVSTATRRIGRRVNWQIEPLFLRGMTRHLYRSCAGRDIDIILALGWTPFGAMGTTPVPPIVYWGDATLAQRLDQAPFWSNVSKRTRRSIPSHEGGILRSMAGVVMPSAWAADDVVTRYAVPRERVHVVPFGSNIEDPGPVTRVMRPSAIRMLVVGVEWKRKGIDRAVLITDRLHELGIDASLDVAGVEPPSTDWTRPYVTFHGFLSKDTPVQSVRLHGLYQGADLMLLPTRNDPFPIVLAEAASYGLPAMATAVGGIPERLGGGSSGILVDVDADVDAWSAEIVALINDPDRYARLSSEARRHFETGGHWDHSIADLLSILQSTAAAKS